MDQIPTAATQATSQRVWRTVSGSLRRAEAGRRFGISLFVDGLRDQTSHQQLKDAFFRFGRILGVFVQKTRRRQRQSKFGFVRFNLEEDAMAAMRHEWQVPVWGSHHGYHGKISRSTTIARAYSNEQARRTLSSRYQSPQVRKNGILRKCGEGNRGQSLNMKTLKITTVFSILRRMIKREWPELSLLPSRECRTFNQ